LNDTGGDLTVGPGSSFTDNQASVFGGGIYNDAGTASVTGSSFSYNTAEFGGALANFSGALTLSQSTIQHNSAAGGGGMDNIGATLTVSGCDIEFNLSSLVEGGGIRTIASGITSVTGSIVVNNSPDDTYTEAGSTLINVNLSSIIGKED
jgi:predicted outer membrane repeat protein